MHQLRPAPRPRRRAAALAAGALACLVAACHRQQPAPAPTPAPPPPNSGPVAGGLPTVPNGPTAPGPAAPTAPAAAFMTGAGIGEPNPRPYALVVNPGTRTREGLVTTHQTRGRLYFELPPAVLGRDMLIVRSLRGTQAPPGGLPFTTQSGDRLVRWERRENRILLRGVEYRNVATDTTSPVARAVEIVTYQPIIAAFNVEAFGRDSAPVVDVTRLFVGGVPDLLQGAGGRATADPSRSFIEQVSAYATNVEVEASQTNNSASPQFTPGPGGVFFGGGAAGTELYHYSMVLLPDAPMPARLYDARVGYFATRRADFGTSEQRVARRLFVNRWRLECSERREGGLCYPRRPITYYVDPATPTWLVDWVRRGVEEWQPAFEAAGFKQAIVARTVPADSVSVLRGENANVSMVRWVPSASENAVGPSTVDPRSGEILDADVQVFHNMMNLNRAWYFTQVAHLDARAQRLPFPDSLMGRLMQFVVAHEVGHTLGLRHNMKASSTYPTDSVRRRAWVARMGHSPSIMDYSRFNYVAQPEDSIPLGDLLPRVGPYDKYAIMWGYRPIPDARTPDDERATTDGWSRMQDSVPWYRFGGDEGLFGPDPGEANEAVGDQDAVKATGYGLRNIRRVARLLEPATAGRPGEDYDDLRELYARLVDQWATELGHVARIPGGEYRQEKYVGQRGPVFTAVPKARQRAAVAFLNANAFVTPEYLLDREVLRKIEASGSLDRVGNAQRRILNTLLDNQRLQRMIEAEGLARDRASVYTAGELLADLRRGVWSETARGGTIDPYRRRLQLNYLEVIGGKINGGSGLSFANLPGMPAGLFPSLGSASDARALLRGELADLDRELAGAAPRVTDRTTRLHLQGARDQIQKILFPEGGGRR
jgi:hypothetical protein